MAYQFYFDGAEIPITPGKITFKFEGNNKTYTLIDEGEINVLKLPSLQEISFDVLLPTQVYPFANNGETSPSTWLDTFGSYQQNKTPFQFVIVRTTDAGSVYHGTSVRCAIESYETEESADDYGTDVNVAVTLKEYKDYGTKTVVISAGSASLNGRREQDNAPTTPAEVDTDKADNPVAMGRIFNNTSETRDTIANKNNYYLTYGDGTGSQSGISAYWSAAKDNKTLASKTASRDSSAYWTTKNDTSKISVPSGKALINGTASSSSKSSVFTKKYKAPITTNGKSASDLLATAIANRDTSVRKTSQAMTFELIK